MDRENNYTGVREAYLAFGLGKELFAISVHKVLDILEAPKVTKVPKTADYMSGVINRRGDILPVIDMALKFNLKADKKYEDQEIVVLEIQNKESLMNIGISVDYAKDVLEIDETEIQPVPDIGSQYNTKFISGMFKKHEQFIMILDVDKIFTIDNLINDAKTEIIVNQ